MQSETITQNPTIPASYSVDTNVDFKCDFSVMYNVLADISRHIKELHDVLVTETQDDPQALNTFIADIQMYINNATDFIRSTEHIPTGVDLFPKLLDTCVEVGVMIDLLEKLFSMHLPLTNTPEAVPALQSLEKINVQSHPIPVVKQLIKETRYVQQFIDNVKL